MRQARQPSKAYRHGGIQSQLPQAERRIRINAEEYLSEIENSVEAARSKAIPKKKKDVEVEHEVCARRTPLIKSISLFKNRDTDYLFSELQKAERQGKANDMAFKMVMNAYPKEFDDF